jgi:hypothetical protein
MKLQRKTLECPSLFNIEKAMRKSDLYLIIKNEKSELFTFT